MTKEWTRSYFTLIDNMNVLTTGMGGGEGGNYMVIFVANVFDSISAILIKLVNILILGKLVTVQ